MDGCTLAGIADPMDIADKAEDLVMLATTAWLASEGMTATGSHSATSNEALSHLLCRLRDNAESLAAMAGNRAPRWRART
jgi:predicted alternative tryptophan synthase beta-subunit